MNLVEIFERFPTQDDCVDHLESVRWMGRPKCPYCQSDSSTPTKDERRHHCNTCNTTYSVTVGTIFHQTHLPLQKWFLAVTLMLNAKKGLSSRQLSRDLKVNKDTAWRISMKIREAMNESDQRRLLTGIVEADETYIGGKPRKGKPGDKAKRGRGTKKTPVVGFIERDGIVECQVVTKFDLTARRLNRLVREKVDTNGAVLFTDEYGGYARIRNMMPHEVVVHSHWYVRGHVHTNNIESFWAIVKRGIIGQFHKVSLQYLPSYINEFCYRFNHRSEENLFDLTIQRGLGVCHG